MKPSDIMFNNNISNRNKFGEFLKVRRQELGLKKSELAAMLNLTRSYIADIENGNRAAPQNHLGQLIDILRIETEEIPYFVDLAGCYHENWADINQYLFAHPTARKAIRLMRDNNIPAQTLSSWITEQTKDL